MTIIAIIVEPITSGWVEGLNREGRRKRLEIRGDRRERTRPRRVRGHFYDNIEC